MVGGGDEEKEDLGSRWGRRRKRKNFTTEHYCSHLPLWILSETKLVDSLSQRKHKMEAIHLYTVGVCAPHNIALQTTCVLSNISLRVRISCKAQSSPVPPRHTRIDTVHSSQSSLLVSFLSEDIVI